MTKDEQQLLEQLETECNAIKKIEVPEQWKKPDNGPMLTLLAIKDFGPTVIPVLAKLMLTNIDLLRENNAVQRRHMKSEGKILFLTKALLILTFVLAFIAIPPAIESLRNLWVLETNQNPPQVEKNINQPTKTKQNSSHTDHKGGGSVEKND
jgi:hypothetical protein